MDSSSTGILFKVDDFTIYKDGHVQRAVSALQTVPAGFDAGTSVTSKDVVIDDATGLAARLYLPLIKTAPSSESATAKLPVVVFFHGGYFIVGSPGKPNYHRYVNSLAANSRIIAVSVRYRLAPEHLLPASYDDVWAALNWAATGADTWLSEHGDLGRIFVVGVSAGANIAHNMAVRAAAPGALPDGVTLRGLVLVHPYFTGKEAVGGEIDFGPEIRGFMDRTWRYVVSETSGLDDPRVNPFVDDAARKASAAIPCQRVLVCVAEKDVLLKERELWYYRELKASGYAGEMELFQQEGVDHAYHFSALESEAAIELQERLVSFVKK